MRLRRGTRSPSLEDPRTARTRPPAPDGPPGPTDDASPGLADHLLEYVREPTLWPVLLVGVAIFVTLVSAALLAALRDRNLFAALALVVLLGLTADAVSRELRRRGMGPVTGIALVIWGLSCGVALGVIGLGWF